MVLALNAQTITGSNNTLGRHDPYRFTRSAQQAVDAKITDYPKLKCRPGGTTGGMIECATSKPLPLPKSPPQLQQQQSHKPVPPPKPKNFPVQQQQQQQHYQPSSNGFQHSKSFGMADTAYSSHLTNGIPSSPSNYSSESTDVNTYGRLWSWQQFGQRLQSPRQRTTALPTNGSQPYALYKHHGDPNALHLTQHRDQRGSAFELCKKPSVAGDHRPLNGGDHRMFNGIDHRMSSGSGHRMSNVDALR